MHYWLPLVAAHHWTYSGRVGELETLELLPTEVIEPKDVVICRIINFHNTEEPRSQSTNDPSLVPSFCSCLIFGLLRPAPALLGKGPGVLVEGCSFPTLKSGENKEQP